MPTGFLAKKSVHTVAYGDDIAFASIPIGITQGNWDEDGSALTNLFTKQGYFPWRHISYQRSCRLTLVRRSLREGPTVFGSRTVLSST
jgi:hypothetical protein